MKLNVAHIHVNAEGDPNDAEFVVDIIDEQTNRAVYLTVNELATVSLALNAITQLVELGRSL